MNNIGIFKTIELAFSAGTFASGRGSAITR